MTLGRPPHLHPLILLALALLSSDIRAHTTSSSTSTSATSPPPPPPPPVRFGGESVCVGILARNAEHLLPSFLSFFEKQDFPREQLGVVFFTDHNEDGTATYLEGWRGQMQQQRQQPQSSSPSGSSSSSSSSSSSDGSDESGGSGSEGEIGDEDAYAFVDVVHGVDAVPRGLTDSSTDSTGGSTDSTEEGGVEAVGSKDWFFAEDIHTQCDTMPHCFPTKRYVHLASLRERAMDHCRQVGEAGLWAGV